MKPEYQIPLQSGGAFLVTAITGGRVLISGPKTASLTRDEARELAYGIEHASLITIPSPFNPNPPPQKQARRDNT